MEKEFLNIFIDAWNTVIESFSSRPVMRADIRTQIEYTDGKRGISAFINIIGDIDGQFSMSMDADTGKALASEMLGGMEITEVNEMVTSAVGELCNMVMGNACSVISSTNANVDITPPTVVTDTVAPQFDIKPTYTISFLLEDQKVIDFVVAVKTPSAYC